MSDKTQVVSYTFSKVDTATFPDGHTEKPEDIVAVFLKPVTKVSTVDGKPKTEILKSDVRISRAVRKRDGWKVTQNADGTYTVNVRQNEKGRSTKTGKTGKEGFAALSRL